MIITGGKLKGRRLPHVSGTMRPTGARQREMLFNILAHGEFLHLAECHVLDCFCGTGAFGLEALSRGSAFATFLDVNAVALSHISKTATDYGLAGKSKTVQANALCPPLPKNPVDLVFLDPPFDETLAVPALHALTDQGWLKSTSIIICELPKRVHKKREHTEKDIGMHLEEALDGKAVWLQTRTSGASSFVFLEST